MNLQTLTEALRAPWDFEVPEGLAWGAELEEEAYEEDDARREAWLDAREDERREAATEAN